MYFKGFVSRYKPVLQVALDYTRLEDAVGLAAALRHQLGAVFIAEAGTPLVKKEGIRAVSILARTVEPAPVLADLKTADTGGLEASMAAEAGAHATTVLGCAANETIEAAVEAAHSRGVAVVADLIGVSDPIARAEELASLGVDGVELHIGIDVQQRLGITAAEVARLVEKVREKFPGMLAVAGGLNAETAPRMAEAGADIIVVGGAITRAPKPVEAARNILEALRSRR
jgi:3-hexulose-6-phosphate synthase